MRKLSVGTFVTLDGVMQAPGGPDEDREGSFEHGGWLVPYFRDEVGETIQTLMDRAETLLLGRKTYEIFAGYWPHAPADEPMAARLNSIEKLVASRTLASVEWQNASLIKGDVAQELARIKEGPGGEIHVPGSGNLIQTLLKHDLVDELHLIVFPVVLGTGKRLFGEGTIPAALRLMESETVGQIAIMAFERTGVPEYGTIGV